MLMLSSSSCCLLLALTNFLSFVCTEYLDSWCSHLARYLSAAAVATAADTKDRVAVENKNLSSCCRGWTTLPQAVRLALGIPQSLSSRRELEPGRRDFEDVAKLQFRRTARADGLAACGEPWNAGSWYGCVQSRTCLVSRSNNEAPFSLSLSLSLSPPPQLFR